MTPVDMQETFVATLMACLTMGATIDLLNNKITYIKKAIKATGKATAADGSVYRFIKPEGMTQKTYLADKTTPVKTVPRVVDLIRLAIMVPTPLLDVLYPEWTELGTKGKAKDKMVFKSDPELLPLYVAELAKLKKEYVEIYSDLRPLEMGLIEAALTKEGTLPEFIEIGDHVLEIEQNARKDYNLPADMKDGLASGKYVKVEEKSTRGKWELVPATQTVTV